jgi:hypothetical protein
MCPKMCHLPQGDKVGKTPRPPLTTMWVMAWYMNILTNVMAVAMLGTASNNDVPAPTAVKLT